MTIRVIDLEKITKHYKTYRDGMSNIKERLEVFKQRVEPIRKEMQRIITQGTTGIVVDNLTEKERGEKFQRLQQELMSIDADYKQEMQDLHGNLNTKTYDELEVIVQNWAKENNIDLVTGKMEVIFSSPNIDATSDILELLKANGTYVEETIEEKV